MKKGPRVREAVGARSEEEGCRAGLAEVLVDGMWLDGLRDCNEKERDVVELIDRSRRSRMRTLIY